MTTLKSLAALPLVRQGLFVAAGLALAVYGRGVDLRLKWLLLVGGIVLWVGWRVAATLVRREPLASLQPRTTLELVHVIAAAILVAGMGALAFHPEWTHLKWLVPVYLVFLVGSMSFAVILRHQREVDRERHAAAAAAKR